MKEMLYAVRCLKSNEDMILALAGQFKQLSHELGKFNIGKDLMVINFFIDEISLLYMKSKSN